MNYILDTNICIYIIKRKPVQVFDRLLSIPAGCVAISSITLAELQYGIAKSSNPEKNSDALEKFLIPLEVVGFDSSAAIDYGKIRADLEHTGRIIGPLDMLIAAHAKSLNAILVTNNEKEFIRIPELRIENWV